MRIVFYYSMVLLSMGFFVSCNKKSNASIHLENARNLAEDRADSAIKFIDSITFFENDLNEEEYMQYLITKVQVRYKNYLPITLDTLIFKARDYMDRNNGSDNDRFLAHFYSACVFRENDEYSSAIHDYKKALSIASKQNNNDGEALVLYNIADLYFSERAYAKALEYYISASKKYEGNKENKLKCLHAAGQSSLLNGEKEIAFRYFEKALHLAKQIGNKVEEAKCLQNIAVALSDQREYGHAASLFRQANEVDTDPNAHVRFNLNMANTYFSWGKKDSANFYSEELKKSIEKVDEVYLLLAANTFLADIYSDKADYFKANNYLVSKDSCLLIIMKNSTVKELAESERKFDVATKETQLLKAESHNYKLALILAVSFLGIGIVGAAVVYFYLQHKKQKEKIAAQEQENHQLIQQAERNECLNSVFRLHIGNIAFLKDQINNLLVKYNRKDVKDPSEGFDKIKKLIAEMESTANNRYMSFISNYLQSLNLMEDDQIVLFKQEEQLLITLLHAQYEHVHIASLLQIKNHALTTRKARLKEKLFSIGLSESKVSEILRLK